MSEESSPDTSSTSVPDSSPVEPGKESFERVGFCQDCGRPLSKETVRNVGTGVFCEPCLEARIATPGAAYGATGYNTPPADVPIPPFSTVTPPPVSPTGEPSPVLAGFLGLIPGVGAIYNGQYAKGVVHLVIFAVLQSLNQNVSGIFGLFVFGWVVYQAFEAYHTAIARRDGLPLPNAFGFNDIGERMGFGKTWGAAHSAKPESPVSPTSSTPPQTPPPYVPSGTVPVGTAPDWVGYVPPTVFASASPADAAAQEREKAAHNAGYSSYAAYAETYTGAGYTYPVGPAVPPPYGVAPTPTTARRFPTGALWLIALGTLILIGNLIPDWRMSERWLLPVLFAGLAAWSFTRGLRTGVSIVCRLRWPILLTVLAVLFSLQAAYVATLGQTWPILFIALGVVLLLERTAGKPNVYVPSAAYGPPPAAYTSVVPPVDLVPHDTPNRAAWTETDKTKDGQ
jgi:hypothetical protein